MTDIKSAFQNGKAFIPFVTAGDPDLETTEKLLIEMSKNGADIIEIGIPFSDPIAEGVVIQEADLRSLSAGTTTDKIFDMVKRIRPQIDAVLTDYSGKYGIDVISLIAPTSHERIKMIAKEAEGFVYCVSSMGVTGVRSEITTDVGEMVRLVKSVKDIPCAIGFGISTPEQAKKMSESADGVIVGSAIVKIVAKYGQDCIKPVCDYVKSMKEAIS